MKNQPAYLDEHKTQLRFLRQVMVAATAVIDTLLSTCAHVDADEPIPTIEEALMKGLSLSKVEIHIREDFNDEPLAGDEVVAGLLRLGKAPRFTVGLRVQGQGRIPGRSPHLPDSRSKRRRGR